MGIKRFEYCIFNSTEITTEICDTDNCFSASEFSLSEDVYIFNDNNDKWYFFDEESKKIITYKDNEDYLDNCFDHNPQLNIIAKKLNKTEFQIGRLLCIGAEETYDYDDVEFNDMDDCPGADFIPYEWKDRFCMRVWNYKDTKISVNNNMVFVNSRKLDDWCDDPYDDDDYYDEWVVSLI